MHRIMKKNPKGRDPNSDYEDQILAGLERSYQKAVQERKESFLYDGKEYKTVFAKQLIKYLKLNGPPFDA